MSVVVPLQLTAPTPLFTVHVTAPVVAAVTLTVSAPVVASVVTVLLKPVMTASEHTLPAPHVHAPASSVLHAQSPAVLQPHTLFTHAVPLALPAQLATHAPVVVSQHPPLHGCVASHATPHWPLALHASSVAQSAADAQPQALATHALSSAWPAQLAHAPPAAPHDAALVSVAQKPTVPPSAKSQHAPLHGCAPSHVEVHVPGLPEVPLHAPDAAFGHSVSAEHPHEPPPVCGSHVSPMLLPKHDAHTAPPAPHAPVAVPAVQKPTVPPSVMSQHPPLHGWLAEHAVTHDFVATSHAWPVAQSAAVAHPQ